MNPVRENLRARRSAASRCESRIKSNEEIWKGELKHERIGVCRQRVAAPVSWQCISRVRRGQAREIRFDLYFSRILI